jgi:opacity protein-like surface antigen
MSVKRIVLTAAAGFAATAAPAFAQTADWSGLYIGGSAGYSEASGNSGETLVFDTDRDGQYGDTVNTAAPANAFSPGFCNGVPNGNTPAAGCVGSDGEFAYAVRAGYDWQMGAFVFGLVGEASKSDIGDAVTGFSTTPASYTFQRQLDYTLAARARAGYAFDSFLVYGTAGFAWGELDRSFTTSNGANSFTPSGDDDASGYQVGGGFEWMLNSNMSIGLEYLRTSLDDDDYLVDVGPGTAGPTNPFLIVNPTGTLMKRSEDKFEYDTYSVTAAWRF